MHLSYPPNDILRSLSAARGIQSDPEVSSEYDRYRWAVLEWCLHNWSRIKANAAKEDFVEQAKAEVFCGSPLVEQLLEGCSSIANDETIVALVSAVLDELARLEKERPERGADRSRIERVTLLDNGLTLFFTAIEEKFDSEIPREPVESLRRRLVEKSHYLGENTSSLIQNLLLRSRAPGDMRIPNGRSRHLRNPSFEAETRITLLLEITCCFRGY